MKKKTYAFSAKALTSATPMWARNMFRITFAVTSALSIFMAATNLIAENYKFEVLLGLKSLDALIYALSKMFGVDPPEKEN